MLAAWSMEHRSPLIWPPKKSDKVIFINLYNFVNYECEENIYERGKAFNFERRWWEKEDSRPNRVAHLRARFTISRHKKESFISIKTVTFARQINNKYGRRKYIW